MDRQIKFRFANYCIVRLDRMYGARMRPIAAVVAWSVCVSLCVTTVNCAKRLNRSRCRLGYGLVRAKELCIRRGPKLIADWHSLQFTIYKIVYRIVSAMSKDLYIEISAHLGIESVENLVANRRNRFINRYDETDNYLCQMLRWLVRLSGCIVIYCVYLFSVC